MGSARDAEQVRWRQYRAIWSYVERSQCRRRAVLEYFGDRSVPAPVVPCCDSCDPSVAPPAPAPPVRAGRPVGSVGGSAAGSARAAGGDLAAAIVEVVGTAAPPVGRTRAVEILRGGRSKVIEQYSYDSLDAYGAFAHLRGPEVLSRVDELLADGTLRSTGGRFPKLRAA
jgi:ATP-dependent DNA helicase RecQ